MEGIFNEVRPSREFSSDSLLHLILMSLGNISWDSYRQTTERYFANTHRSS